MRTPLAQQIKSEPLDPVDIDPRRFAQLIEFSAYYIVCKDVLAEFMHNNGYAVYSTEGYGWQTFKTNDIGLRPEKLELFATYPDALRYVLNRIQEDHSRELD